MTTPIVMRACDRPERWDDHAVSVIEGRTSVRARVILSIMFPDMANESTAKDNALLRTAFDEVSRKFDEATRPRPSTSPLPDQSPLILTPTSQNVPPEDTNWKTAAALGLASVSLVLSAPFLSKAAAKIMTWLTPHPQPGPQSANIGDAPAKDTIRIF